MYHTTHPLEYLSGVLHGDGWCTEGYYGLRVADKDFADAFVTALNKATGTRKSVVIDERGFFTVRGRNTNGRFTHIKDCDIVSDEAKGAWLRGLFDSEGNANLMPMKVSPQAVDRRIAYYSTNEDTLAKADQYLSDLGITTRTRAMKNTVGHIGTKIVYELRLRGSLSNYAQFARCVGSSIERKNTVVQAIPSTYDNVKEKYRAGQQKSVASRLANKQERLKTDAH